MDSTSAESGVTRAFEEDTGPEPIEEARRLAELERRLFGTESDGIKIERYELRQRIAAGGFGSVYLGFDPRLGRHVAVKVLRGRDTVLAEQDARARFLREAQALASFSHPNVVAVYDAGTFEEDGQHGVFIVMELIEGPTLAKWLAEKPRGWRELVEVFAAAGRGLASAHAHGIVHRDFKPSNVLLGDDGRVRVLDFGLARPIEGQSSDNPLPPDPRHEPATDDLNPPNTQRSGDTDRALASELTRTGTILGTPAYMAPEQHAGEPSDASADQYAFCVSLYEALFGKRPFLGQYRDILSAKVRGRIPPPAADRAVPGRLVHVVMRGLAADPGKRFPSMSELLAALTHDPSKRWRRIAGATAVSGAVAGGVLLGYGVRDTDDPCKDDDMRFVGVWDEDVIERSRAGFASMDAPFAAQSWKTVERELGAYVTRWRAVRQEACHATQERGEVPIDVLHLRLACLDGNLRRLAGLTDLFPVATEAVVRGAPGMIANLPSLDACLRDTAAALETGGTREDALEVADAVGRAYALSAMGRPSEALPIVADALDAAQRRGDRLSEARLVHARGDLELAAGRFDDAEASLQAALTLAEQDDHKVLAAEVLLSTLELLVMLGRFDAGDRMADVAAARVAAVAPGSRMEASLLMWSGSISIGRTKFEEAEERLKRGLVLTQERVGADHLNVASFHSALGRCYAISGDIDRAEREFRRTLEVYVRHLGEHHPQVARAITNLGSCDIERGRYRESAAMFRRAIVMFERGSDPGAALPLARSNLAGVLEVLGHSREALAASRQATEEFEKISGHRDPSWALAAGTVGILLGEIGKYQEAVDQLEHVIEVIGDTLGSEHPHRPDMLLNLGLAYADVGRGEEGVETINRSLDIYRRRLGNEHASVARALTLRGDVELRAGRPQKALRTIEEARAMWARLVGSEDVQIAWADLSLARVLLELRDPQRAHDAAERALPRIEAVVGAHSASVIGALLTLGQAKTELGRADEAIPLLERAAGLASSPDIIDETREQVRGELAKARRAAGRR